MGSRLWGALLSTENPLRSKEQAETDGLFQSSYRILYALELGADLPCGGSLGAECFSSIARAGHNSVSASARSPVSLKNSARSYRQAAVAGWTGPKAFSSIARARRNNGSASR